jgi:hypothetical protein
MEHRDLFVADLDCSAGTTMVLTVVQILEHWSATARHLEAQLALQGAWLELNAATLASTLAVDEA